METREAFGSWLRAEREQRGVSLDAIAAATKLRRALLAALEAGDVSSWPDGIVRRAYVRQYLAAIGLPAPPVLAEFVRLFPDTSESHPFSATRNLSRELHQPGLVVPDGEIRMSLEANLHLRRTRRLLAASAEMAVVASSGGALGYVLQVDPWMPVAVVALLYYPLTAIVATSDRLTPVIRHVRVVARGGRAAAGIWRSAIARAPKLRPGSPL